MIHSITEIFQATPALGAGILIGLGFGAMQRAAQRRHERLQSEGKLDNGWAIMPGSMRRVAFLLLILAAIQVVCPMLFAGGTEWWVSGGLVAGYGWMLVQQLRERRREFLRTQA